jgi:NAD(P)H-flavin reductase/ferredoxin
MTNSAKITIDGTSFSASRGDLLLEAALRSGIDLPHQCRAGHCGTCCVRLISGEVLDGGAHEPGLIRACQCRIAGDMVVEQLQMASQRTLTGTLKQLRPLSSEVMEVGIKTVGPLPYHSGQYAVLRFSGYPPRPYSFTHPILDTGARGLLWFHVRRLSGGKVTAALGKAIRPGHAVSLTGPYGSAYFRSNMKSRMVLVATNTGFAPIWSIASAALRENPYRMMLLIAGGRSLESLYMGPALNRLACFPNVRVVPVCSQPESLHSAIQLGRPTDFLPRLLPRDEVYACGAAAMVDTVKIIAARSGAICYADPFLPSVERAETRGFSDAIGLLRRLFDRSAPIKRHHQPKIA